MLMTMDTSFQLPLNQFIWIPLLQGKRSCHTGYGRCVWMG